MSYSKREEERTETTKRKKIKIRTDRRRSGNDNSNKEPIRKRREGTIKVLNIADNKDTSEEIAV